MALWFRSLLRTSVLSNACQCAWTKTLIHTNAAHHPSTNVFGRSRYVCARYGYGSCRKPSHESHPIYTRHYCQHTKSKSSSNSNTHTHTNTQTSSKSKTGAVKKVFSSVHERYDIMNDVMSFGVHRLWKDYFVGLLRPFAGTRYLDIAGGTGDIAFRLVDQLVQASPPQALQSTSSKSSEAIVEVCDINADMLRVGRKRAAERSIPSCVTLNFSKANAECLPFAADSFDACTMAFGLRNITNPHLALRELFRVLKSGGRFLCLEFFPYSNVSNNVIRALYNAYSTYGLPFLGQTIANDASAYEYLRDSIRYFMSPAKLAQLMTAKHFERVTYENLSNGIVAIHSGYKLMQSKS